MIMNYFNCCFVPGYCAMHDCQITEYAWNRDFDFRATNIGTVLCHKVKDGSVFVLSEDGQTLLGFYSGTQRFVVPFWVKKVNVVDETMIGDCDHLIIPRTVESVEILAPGRDLEITYPENLNIKVEALELVLHEYKVKRR